MLKSFLQNKKVVSLTASFFFLLFLVGTHIGYVSNFHFSDGIPMLIRLNRFYDGEFDILNYLFQKHGNSIHSVIYLLAWIDDVFFSSTADFLKFLLFFSMIGTAFLINWITYRKDLSVIENLIVFLISDVIIAGTYNFDLYLPFQNCLTFSRLIYVFLMWKIAGCLSAEEQNHYGAWLVASVAAAPLHGMGMMFSLGLFYLHIATKQKVKRILLSLLPFAVYTFIQLFFSGNYGEVSNVSRWLFKYFGELILSILSFYGGFCYVLLGFNKYVSMGIGFVLFIGTFLSLSYFFINPFFRIKKLPDISLTDRKAVFAVGLLAISFLCSIGSASFVVARKNGPSYDSVFLTISTCRYLCYSIVPYIILLYLSSKNFCKESRQRIVFTFYIILLSVFLYRNGFSNISQHNITANSELDREAVALLSGLKLDTEEIKKGYYSLAGIPFYVKSIPQTYARLKDTNRYIWHNQPQTGMTALNLKIQDIAMLQNVSFSDTSDPAYVFVKFNLPVNIGNRYIPLIDKGHVVVGFSHKIHQKSFNIKNRKIYFQRMYGYEGYMKKNAVKNNPFYALLKTDVSYNHPSELPAFPVIDPPPAFFTPRAFRFSDKTLPFETSGLSFAESWGRWSDGDSVKFQFDLPKNRPLKFVFKDTHAFVPQENPMVTATVFVNGKQVAQWIFEYNIAYPKTEFTVPMDILKIKRPLEIEIKIDGANSPASLGTGQDERRLGIGFHSLTITP